MPDFERRSSASFISSKDGGTPASLSLSLMKRSSSYCLRVSIANNPRLVARRSIPKLVRCVLRTLPLETNHERTLYVRYVFRNHLILGEQDELLSGTRKRPVNPAVEGCRRRCLSRPPLQRADVSLIPVPQREIRAARSPDE